MADPDDVQPAQFTTLQYAPADLRPAWSEQVDLTVLIFATLQCCLALAACMITVRSFRPGHYEIVYLHPARRPAEAIHGPDRVAWELSCVGNWGCFAWLATSVVAARGALVSAGRSRRRWYVFYGALAFAIVMTVTAAALVLDRAGVEYRWFGAWGGADWRTCSFDREEAWFIAFAFVIANPVLVALAVRAARGWRDDSRHRGRYRDTAR